MLEMYLTQAGCAAQGRHGFAHHFDSVLLHLLRLHLDELAHHLLGVISGLMILARSCSWMLCCTQRF